MENFDRIELFGYPGSGKTTSLNVIHKRHFAFNLKKSNVAFTLKNSFSLIGYIIRNPKAFSLFTWLRYVPFSRYKNYLNTIIRFLLRIQAVEKDIQSNDRYIVDEGVLQITWSLLLLPAIYNRSFEINKKLAYLQNNWWPDVNILVYHLKVSDEEYIQRIKSRVRMHFFSNAFLNNDERVVHIGKHLSDTIIEHVIANCNNIIIRRV